LFAEGSEEAILALAPLLLLLNQDPILFPQLTDRRRYVPPFVATVLYLFATALAGAARASSRSGVAASLAMLALLCPIPDCLLLGAYLWNRRRQSEWWLLFFTPANVLPALFAEAKGARLLAIAAMVGALVQAIAMRRSRRAATKLI
jgi:hypothetical protein